MAFALGIYENGAQALDLNAGAFSVIEYKPTLPARVAEAGDYDLYNPIQDRVKLQVTAATRTAWDAAVNALESLLMDAARWKRVLELAHIPDQGTLRVYAQIRQGWVERTESEMFAATNGQWTAEVEARIVRQPDWQAAEQSVTLTTDIVNNGLNNYLVIPALLGQLPARGRVRIVGSGGNIANAKVLAAAVRSRQNPANFTHVLHGASYSYKDAGVSDFTDANFAGGNGISFTPTAANQTKVMRWTLIGQAALDAYGTQLFGVRYRDRAATPNFLLQARVGTEVSGVIQWGNTSGAPVKTRTVDAANNVEAGWLDVGLIAVPKANRVVIELAMTALANSGALHVNYAALYPFGDPLPAKGMQVVTYPFGIAGNRAYATSYIGEDVAWLADLSDVKLASAVGYPEGGDLLFVPGLAGQRVYVTVTRDGADGFRHDHTTTLDATLWYRPRFVLADGGV